jgi:drug/metabolite transporter (DMT)-like permease
MHILALNFNAHETLRVEEIAGALAAIAGAALLLGALAPLARRTGQIFGGLALFAAGVLFVLAVRYGIRP